MPEMVAAHLVAKAQELVNHILEYLDEGQLDEYADIAQEAMINPVAAALAACARERDRSNREYYKDVLNKAGRMQTAWVIHETPILSEAERAVGEKA